MNCQDFGSHRRLYITVSLQRLGSQVSGPVTRVHFAPQAVKLLRAVLDHSGVLASVGSSHTEMTAFLQQLEEPGHHLLIGAPACESCASDTKAIPSLITIEILRKTPSGKHLVSGEGRGSSFIKTGGRAWPKRDLEAMPPTETLGKGRTVTFPNVYIREEKPQSSPLQSHEGLWKNLVIEDDRISFRTGPKMLSQYPQPEFFEDQVLEGIKMQTKKKPPMQATLPAYRWEMGRKGETQTLKQKMRSRRAKEMVWLQFLPDKSLLEQRQRDLSSLFLGGKRLLDKKKTKVLHLKASSRAGRRNLQSLAQGDSKRKATRKQSKKEKRKMRVEWWDPTVWGAPVILAKRERFPRKTYSELDTGLRKLSFPVGRSSY